jgi:hypothetical protein
MYQSFRGHLVAIMLDRPARGLSTSILDAILTGLALFHLTHDTQNRGTH